MAFGHKETDARCTIQDTGYKDREQKKDLSDEDEWKIEL